MRFLDEVEITVISGHGGPGAISFRREKFIPFGGPDGGNGGKGGDIYVIGDEGLNTLIHFRGKKVFQAQNGEKGRGWQCDGKTADDIELKVPIGTIIKNKDTGDVLADVTHHNQKVLVAKGGNGGRGNMHFKSSINQAPEHAQPGLPGETVPLKLELKLLADIALVGLPNAGKSTLISTISAARPKIADYPFTTLEPNLGVVSYQDKSWVVADIPGLIEGASQGKGLGIKFLKHIERTKALVHLIDCSMLINEYEAMELYSTVRHELLEYGTAIANKSEIICLTKIDAMSEEEIQKFQKYLEESLDKKVLPISAVSGRNIEVLKNLMFMAIQGSNEK